MSSAPMRRGLEGLAAIAGAAEERKLLDETFHLMAARMDKAN
jgi:hypothetical protein